ncbi:MAG TPA: universal stress protein [Dehalococcoidia bacterium]|jgi:nucleotide-binding universal stress UspA family protein
MSDLTILIPLDGSKAAELPLTFVAALKPLADLRIRLLSVSEPGEHDDEPLKAAEAYIDGVCARTEAQYGVPVEGICLTGDPYAEVLEEARRPEVGILLMSTHGRSMSEDPERIGGVADKVIRGAPCPVLLVGPHASVPLKIEAITVPLDGSRLAAEAIPAAKALAERLGASIRLVQVVQAPASLDPDAVGSLAADVVESQALTAGLYLSEAKLELETSQPVETEVLYGLPAPALLEEVKENRPDLLVMTSHGRTGFVRWALGSVTDRLIRSNVPVLVIRPIEETGDRLKALAGARGA